MGLSDKDKRGIQIIIGIALAAAVLLGITIYLDATRPDLDLVDFCPKDESVPETIVLIDRTDPLSKTQQDFVWKRLGQLSETLTIYEKLSIYALSDDRSTWSAEPLFSFCNPGKKANPLYQTEWQIHQRFRKRFGGPLQEVLRQLLQDKETKQSPIMEMVETLSLKPNVLPSAPRRRLILVSDMMQNVPAYSHYQLPINYSTFASSVYAKAQRVNLSGATVEIVYLERETFKTYQNVQHAEFWEEWFHNNGAKLTRVDRVR